jgi:hypothetical protein
MTTQPYGIIGTFPETALRTLRQQLTHAEAEAARFRADLA